MNKNNFKIQRETPVLLGLLCAFDEEVISHEDYLLIKNKNVNNEIDLRYISDLILKPWFLEYKLENREKAIKSIDFVINFKDSHFINLIISELNFIFDCEIENKPLFLKRIKGYLEEYVKDGV